MAAGQYGSSVRPRCTRRPHSKERFPRKLPFGTKSYLTVKSALPRNGPLRTTCAIVVFRCLRHTIVGEPHLAITFEWDCYPASNVTWRRRPPYHNSATGYKRRSPRLRHFLLTNADPVANQERKARRRRIMGPIYTTKSMGRRVVQVADFAN